LRRRGIVHGSNSEKEDSDGIGILAARDIIYVARPGTKTFVDAVIGLIYLLGIHSRSVIFTQTADVESSLDDKCGELLMSELPHFTMPT